MLTSLRIQNFKCWRDTGEMRLAPITGLFGANSSGKTSILQFLLMLKQTTDTRDRRQVLNFGDANDDYVHLGRFSDILYRANSKERAKQVEWGLIWTRDELLKVADPESKGQPLFLTNKMMFHAIVNEILLGLTPRLAVEAFRYEFYNEINKEFVSLGMQRILQLQYRLFDGEFTLGEAGQREDLLPTPYNCYGFPDEIESYIPKTGFLRDLDWSFDQLFDSIYYLGPLRIAPKRQYEWAGGGGSPSDIGNSGEHTISALLASREHIQSVPPSQQVNQFSVEKQVASWLKQLELVAEFAVEEIAENSGLYQVRVKRTPDSPFVLLPDVGFGVSQVLPVLTLCAHVPEGSIIIFEQPEIHLHPKVQAGLADVFIDMAKKRNVQIILESHSEHLLARLQRRIAENTLTEQGIDAENVALYFCKREGVEAHLEPLVLDEYGYITNWPDDFFGNELEERSAMIEAAIERQQKGEAA